MPLSETITEGAGKTQRDAYRDVLLDMLSGVLQAVQWDPLKGAALAAIDVLKQLPQPSVLVLGDMGEVGENGELYHQEVGAYAQSAGITVMLTLGDLSKASAHAFAAREFKPSRAQAYAATHEGLAQLLLQLDQELQSAQSVLVKGSRFMRMERVVNHVLSKSATRKDSPCS